MLNVKRLFGYLATGVMPERTALDESLAEHDRKYHPDGYKEGDRCNKRDGMAGGDGVDNVAKENCDTKNASRIGRYISSPLTKEEMDDIATAFTDGRFRKGRGEYIRGWILPDGRNVELMPDLDDDWVDHDDIRAVLSKTRDVNSEQQSIEDVSGREEMLAAGGIRYHMLGDEGILEIWSEPSKAQYDELDKLSKFDHKRMSGTKMATVDFGDGNFIQYGSIDDMNRRLVTDIKRHFKGSEESDDSRAVRMFHGGDNW